jgi:hypothetical protein
VLAHGLPLAFYSDQHSIFRVNAKEAQGGDGLTEFGRVAERLRIELIHAATPQAKGRICVERLQGLDPLGKLRPGFVQTIPREHSVLHIATRQFHIVRESSGSNARDRASPVAASAAWAAASTSGSSRLTSADFASFANAAAIRASMEQLDLPLSDKGRNRPAEARPGDSQGDRPPPPETLLRLPQRQNAAVRRQQPPIEFGHHRLAVRR